jgi:tetratricopeptide (TPR) repeat protein
MFEFLFLALTVAAPQPAPLSLAASQESRAPWQSSLDAGRAALLRGRLAEARTHFEQARAQAPESFETELWLLRLDAAEGRAEEVLGQLSRLRRQGRSGAELDYLYGVAFAAQAEAAAARGEGQAGLLFQDAQNSLETALSAEPQRFADAWSILAAAARATGDNRRSLEAAREALAADPESLVAQDLRGRAALALFAARSDEDPRPAEVQAHLDEAREAFTRLTAVLSAPTELEDQRRAASAWNQLGTTHAFAGDLDAARNAYGEAAGFDPASVDFTAILSTLGAERFLQALEFASERFTARYPADDARDATLNWWLGWALYDSRDRERLPAAERAFREAVREWPAYVNSWYYVARVRYDQQDYAGTVEALRENWRANRDNLVGMITADPIDVSRVEYLVGWCATRNLDDAAFLCEVLSAVQPQEPRFWNNLGLFLRDSGDTIRNQLVQAERRGAAVDEVAWAGVRDRYERALQAYERALALQPDNPAYLNDTAVILHYNLERDYDRALEMYARAAELAAAALEAGTVPADEVEIIRLALRDARDNRDKLQKKVAAEREAAGGEGQGSARGTR